MTIEVVRHPRARRTKLSVDPASGTVRLVIPPRASAAKALAWAETKAEWIAAQRAAVPPARPFVPGASLPFGDAALTIDWRPDARRTPERIDDRLVLGGPAETIGRRVEAWLKRQALATLSADTAFYAARAEVAVTKVAIGDARGRWGSCAGHGAIRYSWRLICAPEAVRRATAAHEVAHRVHMHHGPAFHALVADLFGREPAAERAWLRRHGVALHRIGAKE